jgi:hypothetical protein
MAERRTDVGQVSEDGLEEQEGPDSEETRSDDRNEPVDYSCTSSPSEPEEANRDAERRKGHRSEPLFRLDDLLARLSKVLLESENHTKIERFASAHGVKRGELLIAIRTYSGSMIFLL